MLSRRSDQPEANKQKYGCHKDCGNYSSWLDWRYQPADMTCVYPCHRCDEDQRQRNRQFVCRPECGADFPWVAKILEQKHVRASVELVDE